ASGFSPTWRKLLVVLRLSSIWREFLSFREMPTKLVGVAQLNVKADKVRPNRRFFEDFFGQTVVCPYETTPTA
ncbi:MAG: hypothetical protein NZ805_16495, partial [Armatimonadetes bacterium]|nr:hypothetical protein [Armatimonadota bacterium]